MPHLPKKYCKKHNIVYDAACPECGLFPKDLEPDGGQQSVKSALRDAIDDAKKDALDSLRQPTGKKRE